jgi:hypothetical protein
MSLKTAPLPGKQSETVITVHKKSQGELATKTDISPLASKIDLQEMELRLVKWVFGVALGQIAVIATLVKLL